MATLNELQNISMESMYDLPCAPLYIPSQCKGKITRIPCLVNEINRFFADSTDLSWCEKKAALIGILNRVDLSNPTELGKYILYDSVIPYTRNLVATDFKNYTLLLLCWSPGKESKIHDHPCQGCFVKVIQGSIKETLYSVHMESNEIRLEHEAISLEGDVSYMSDDIGLHKIGNPQSDKGSISLHLYIPPFQTCKVTLKTSD